MRRAILLGMLSVAVLSIVLQVSASLVPMAGWTPEITPEPTPAPTSTPLPMATISPGPVVIADNKTSSALPAFVDASNVLDPISATKMDNAMSMFWQPASSSGISPLQAISSYGVSGLTMSPVKPVLGNAVGQIPFNALMSGDTSWLSGQ